MSETIYPFSILFVEDEDAIRQNYVTYLKMIFTDVYEAVDGEQAYQIYKEKQPDIMIIDIHLPKISGIEFLQKVRKKDHATKAIMLTAHTDTNFLLEAAGLKLTKYLTKPINRKGLQEALELAVEELSAFRVSAVNAIKVNNEYSWEGSRKEMRRFGEVIVLTNKEQRLLTLLFSDTTRVFTYDEIFEYVWGYESVGTTDALKSLIKSLRKKIPKECIKNVFGIGYKVKIVKK